MNKVDISKITEWDFESSEEHERPVPKVTQAERDLYHQLSHRSDLQPPELWLRRELHKKFQYREKFKKRNV